MERKLVALSGVAGAGKDTLAKCLIEKGFKRIAFADTLKETCSELFPFLEVDYPPFEKEQPLNIEFEGQLISKTPRELWIETSAFIRQYNPSYFFNKTLKNIEESSDDIVITDLRIESEFLKLKELGFTIIFIEPKVQHYELNDFDKQIDDFKDEIPHTFVNNFNGTEEFEEFILELNL